MLLAKPRTVDASLLHLFYGKAQGTNLHSWAFKNLQKQNKASEKLWLHYVGITQRKHRRHLKLASIHKQGFLVLLNKRYKSI